MTAGEDVKAELRILRSIAAGHDDALDALPPPDASGSLSLAAITVSGGSYPTAGAVGTGFLVQALDVFAPDSEGASATTATRSGSFIAVNLLSGLPPVGTEVLIYHVDYAWVFAYP